MNIPRPVTIDFESDGILPRPEYPPLPIGVSIKEWGKPAVYYAFDHEDGNNCTKNQAIDALRDVWSNPDGILCHNSKFDLDVAETHMGMPPLPWQNVHDTLYLIFLDSPHADTFSLKPTAERLLGMPPEEQDAVCDWLLKYQPVVGTKIRAAKSSPHYFMKYLRYCPGDLVGPYANGDVVRTEKLFELLYQRIVVGGMLEAYDRERRLMPVLLDMERQGVPVDIKRLRADVTMYTHWQITIDNWVHIHLDNWGCNLDSGEQLMDAMVAAGKVDTDKATLTPKSGKYATNKEALLTAVTDPVLLAVLTYRAQLATCLATFMRPWLETASKSAGSLIYSNWNQVRATHGKDTTGARTGRLSSTPNFQNIPKVFKDPFKGVVSPWPDLPSLPSMRSYILPFDGEVLTGRDFSSQELRILAHYENDVMLDLYAKDPGVDLHQRAADLITRETGVALDRTKTKTIAFSILYGSGIAHLSETLHCTPDEAKRLKNAYLAMFPGIEEIQKMLKKRAAHTLPFRTLGKRLYHCEPAVIRDGKRQEFSYKMLNVLIQGSAADMSKESAIRFHDMKTSGQLLLLVHDELVVSCPECDVPEVMAALKSAMNDNSGLDCPVLSDAEIGLNWGNMETYND